eukprot:TRINITY_DN1177_c0_g1_i1.p1 TRINITY_DN1177_c0_g1~~TRINITY_DN1177_c0_g1_i1.p1  ORF type:complete len:706 (-),score=80.07 TRINITY_DN1177_c0_g1_i1:49-2082(-)
MTTFRLKKNSNYFRHDITQREGTANSNIHPITTRKVMKGKLAKLGLSPSINILSAPTSPALSKQSSNENFQFIANKPSSREMRMLEELNFQIEAEQKEEKAIEKKKANLRKKKIQSLQSSPFRHGEEAVPAIKVGKGKGESVENLLLSLENQGGNFRGEKRERNQEEWRKFNKYVPEMVVFSNTYNPVNVNEDKIKMISAKDGNMIMYGGKHLTESKSQQKLDITHLYRTSQGITNVLKRAREDSSIPKVVLSPSNQNIINQHKGGLTTRESAKEAFSISLVNPEMEKEKLYTLLEDPKFNQMTKERPSFTKLVKTSAPSKNPQDIIQTFRSVYCYNLSKFNELVDKSEKVEKINTKRKRKNLSIDLNEKENQSANLWEINENMYLNSEIMNNCYPQIPTRNDSALSITSPRINPLLSEITKQTMEKDLTLKLANINKTGDSIEENKSDRSMISDASTRCTSKPLSEYDFSISHSRMPSSKGELKKNAHSQSMSSLPLQTPTSLKPNISKGNITSRAKKLEKIASSSNPDIEIMELEDRMNHSKRFVNKYFKPRAQALAYAESIKSKKLETSKSSSQLLQDKDFLTKRLSEKDYFYQRTMQMLKKSNFKVDLNKQRVKDGCKGEFLIRAANKSPQNEKPWNSPKCSNFSDEIKRVRTDLFFSQKFHKIQRKKIVSKY